MTFLSTYSSFDYYIFISPLIERSVLCHGKQCLFFYRSVFFVLHSPEGPTEKVYVVMVGKKVKTLENQGITVIVV